MQHRQYRSHFYVFFLDNSGLTLYNLTQEQKKSADLGNQPIFRIAIRHKCQPHL